MKYGYYIDEWYPVVVLISYDDVKGIELSDEERADYDRVMKEFKDWQSKLDKLRWEYVK